MHPRADDWLLTPKAEIPGDCLPLSFSGVRQGLRSAFVDVRLRERILADAFSIEHLAPSISFHFETAPKDVQLYGSTDAPTNSTETQPNELERKGLQLGSLAQVSQGGESLHDKSTVDASGRKHLGNFTYDKAGRAVQTYSLAMPRIIDRIRLVIRSTQGSDEYVCLYRLRVHGKSVL